MKTDEDAHNAQHLDACLNGRMVSLTLDTGCTHTIITRSCAHKLGLTVQETKDRDTGAGGAMSGYDGVASLGSFKLLAYEINRTSVIKVFPRDAYFSGDGLLGYDYLKCNAALLPVGADFFLFKPGASPVPNFDAFLNAMGYQSIPMTYAGGGLRVKGQLNGHPFTAIVDCGASLTLYDAKFVTQIAGLSVSANSMYPDGPGLSRLNMYTEGVDGRRLSLYLFQARGLAFGGIPFGSPDLTASFDSILAKANAQAFLGFDLLAEHRAIIDLGHNVLWLK